MVREANNLATASLVVQVVYSSDLGRVMQMVQHGVDMAQHVYKVRLKGKMGVLEWYLLNIQCPTCTCTKEGIQVVLRRS